MKADLIISTRARFEEFLLSYDVGTKNDVWKEHSKTFQSFWKSKIVNNHFDLNDADADQVIKILDRNGKGNSKGSEAVAKAMIPQGAWRRMFNEIRESKEMTLLLNNIFTEKDFNKKADFINELYRLNDKKRNNLTGRSGNAINSMLAAWDPFNNLSVISLRDRKRIIDFFNLSDQFDHSSSNIGNLMTSSNNIILDGFKLIDIPFNARTLSVFFYSPPIKNLWKPDIPELDTNQPEDGGSLMPITSNEKFTKDPYLFYMESQLEDFLVENWEKTELGKKYDLLEEDGELVSQQYRTDIGIIDILAKDNKSGQYVIIELKRDQTSDDTVGQLARYMGWIEEKKADGKPSKGIIIAAKWDERLYYALKKIKDTEIYLYKVDFKLEEFRK